jgi:hypothetical protein
MMPINVADTSATISDMIAASREIAHSLELLRDNYARADRRLALDLEDLRHTFSTMALAAEARCVTETEVLEKLGTLYETTASEIHEIADGPLSPADARPHVSQVFALTYLCAGLVSSGTRSIFRQ